MELPTVLLMAWQRVMQWGRQMVLQRAQQMVKQKGRWTEPLMVLLTVLASSAAGKVGEARAAAAQG